MCLLRVWGVGFGLFMRELGFECWGLRYVLGCGYDMVSMVDE